MMTQYVLKIFVFVLKLESSPLIQCSPLLYAYIEIGLLKHVEHVHGIDRQTFVYIKNIMTLKRLRVKKNLNHTQKNYPNMKL